MWQLSFLNAAFLWGSALVAVPVVLHLVMRREVRRLEFPALRFVRQRQAANRRQLQLRHWILLALRMAIILLIAAALARPSLQGSSWMGDQEAPVAVAMVFDTQPRMEYRHQNKTRLEAGRETALWLLSQFPRDSEVAVIDARYGSSVFAVDMGAARQRIERLTTSAVGAPLAKSLEDALRLLKESGHQRKEIYVFTDLARSAWSGDASAALAKQLQSEPDVGWYVVDVGTKSPQNAGITSLRLSADAVSRGVPLSIEAEIAHVGSAGRRTVELYLDDVGGSAGEGTPQQRGEQTVNLAEDEPTHVDLHLGGLDLGLHQGFVKLAGSDALVADDIRFFSVEVTDARKLLLAAPAPAEDYTFLLREVLAPYELRLRKETKFDCVVVSLDELAKQPLDEYAAVCLVDPTPLPDEVWQQLANYAADGGGVAVFLGRNARPVEAFASPAAQKVLPGKLVRQWRAGDRDVYLAPDQLEHPLLAKFRPLESAIPWDAYPVYTHWELGPLAKGSGVVIAFSNTLPALIEQPIGRGRVLTMTTPVSDSASDPSGWNRLPTGDEPWPFVVLANEMMYYLTSGTHSKLNYLAGETAVIRLPPDAHQSIFSLIPPHGDPLRQPVDERQDAVVVSGTDMAGNYRLQAGGDDGIRLGFSVNLAADTSQLERTTPAELAAVFGSVPYRIARDQAEIVRDVNLGRVGRELYPLLMLLAVLALLAEQWLANRFYQAGDSSGGARQPFDAAATTKRSAGSPDNPESQFAGAP
ncbi:MAG TPA: BatA domain-containing protein [Pirellulales bacterium]|nr:BatA domain-containing protein [Pirellulales bacterium]